MKEDEARIRRHIETAFNPEMSQESRDFAIKEITGFCRIIPFDTINIVLRMIREWDKPLMHICAFNYVKYIADTFLKGLENEWGRKITMDILSTLAECPLPPSQIKWGSIAGVAIVKTIQRSFPDHWLNYKKALRAWVNTGPGTVQSFLAFAILKCLMEDVITNPAPVVYDSDRQRERAENLVREINNFIREIIPLCPSILQWKPEIEDSEGMAVAKQLMGFLTEVYSKSSLDEFFQDHSNSLIAHVSAFLGTDITQAAAECLMGLSVKRKGSEQAIINAMLCPSLVTRMDKLFEEVDTHGHPYSDTYTNLKVAARVLVNVARCMDKGFVMTEGVKWYLGVLMRMAQHPSLNLRICAFDGLVLIYSYKTSLTQHTELMSMLEKITEVALDLMGREVLGSTIPANAASRYSAGDYVDDMECLVEFNIFRTALSKILELSADRCMNIMLATFEEKVMKNLHTDEVILLECEGWTRYTKQMFASLRRKYGIYDGKHQNMLKRVTSYPKAVLAKMLQAVNISDWNMVNELLSLANAMQPLTIRDKNLMNGYLTLVSKILKSGPDPVLHKFQKQRELKRHCLSCILNSLDTDTEIMRQYVKIMYQLCENCYESLSIMQQATLTQIVAHLSNFVDEERRLVILDNALRRPTEFLLENSASLKDLYSFVKFCGFNLAPNDNDGSDDGSSSRDEEPHVERRRNLRAVITQVEGVLKVARCGVIIEEKDDAAEPEERDFEEEDLFIHEQMKPIFSAACKIASFMLMLTYDFRFVHPGLRPALSKPTWAEVLCVTGRPLEELEDIYSEDPESCVGKTKKFFNDFMETILSFLTTAASNLPQSYGFVFGMEMNAWSAVHYDLVPTFRHRPWIRRYWKQMASSRKRGLIGFFWTGFVKVLDGCMRIQMRTYNELPSNQSSHPECVLADREFVMFCKEIIICLRGVVLTENGAGNELSDENEAPTSLLGSVYGQMVMNNLLLALRTADANTSAKAANLLAICVPWIRKIKGCDANFVEYNCRQIIAVLFVGYAQHGREQNAGAFLCDVVFNLTVVMAEKIYDFVEQVWQCFLDRDRCSTFVNKCLEMTDKKNVRPDERSVRDFVRTTMKEIVGSHSGAWLHNLYEKNNVYGSKKSKHIFEMWAADKQMM